MRSSRRRKLSDKRMKRLVVDIEESVHEDLNRISGPNSYGYTVEELIKREILRRQRRIDKANAITSTNSVVNVYL